MPDEGNKVLVVDRRRHSPAVAQWKRAMDPANAGKAFNVGASIKTLTMLSPGKYRIDYDTGDTLHVNARMLMDLGRIVEHTRRVTGQDLAAPQNINTAGDWEKYLLELLNREPTDAR